MNAFVRKLARFLAAEDGPTTVEYAVMMMLLLLVCLSAVKLVGESTSTSFQNSSRSIQEAME